MEARKSLGMKRVLVTGSNGFIGRNLTSTLEYMDGIEVLRFDRDEEAGILEQYCQCCDFVYHLAGVNRPEKETEYMEGNRGFTSLLIETLQRYKNPCPVMLSSSIQAESDNAYGKSKRAAEDLIHEHAQKTGAKTYIYRFSNLFGKWSRPNYNSVAATFCYNIAHDLPIEIHDPERILELVYIDDVVKGLIQLISPLTGEDGQEYMGVNLKDDRGFVHIRPTYKISVGELAALLTSYQTLNQTRQIPDMSEDSLNKKLYSTYLSYMQEEKLLYPLYMNIDERGSFTEIFRTPERGQFSINRSKPGIEKGNHWHHTKNEKFIVVSGEAVIRLRKIDSNNIIRFRVTGAQLQVVTIPAGYTHSIENTGSTDLVTLIWCNECFDPEHPDTYNLKVKERRE